MSVGLGWIRTVRFHPACFTRPTLPQLAIAERHVQARCPLAASPTKAAQPNPKGSGGRGRRHEPRTPLPRPPLPAALRVHLVRSAETLTAYIFLFAVDAATSGFFPPFGVVALGVALVPEEDCSLLASTRSVVSIAARLKPFPAPARKRLLLRQGSKSSASLSGWCST